MNSNSNNSMNMNNSSNSNSSMMMVTVETSGENSVVEVTYDGQEIIQPPLTINEHLTQQANKIDFNDTDDEAQDDDDEAAEQQQQQLLQQQQQQQQDEDVDEDVTNTTKEAQEAKSMTQQWPWDSVRNKLKNALTEMSVLADVIAISTKEIEVKANGGGESNGNGANNVAG